MVKTDGRPTIAWANPPRALTPAQAIRILTENELSPSTIDLLALERLEQEPPWIDTPEERDELVENIVRKYVP